MHHELAVLHVGLLWDTLLAGACSRDSSTTIAAAVTCCLVTTQSKRIFINTGVAYLDFRSISTIYRAETAARIDQNHVNGLS